MTDRSAPILLRRLNGTQIQARMTAARGAVAPAYRSSRSARIVDYAVTLQPAYRAARRAFSSKLSVTDGHMAVEVVKRLPKFSSTA